MMSSHGLESYEYKPLPGGESHGDFIRYLTLHAGSGDEPLQCTIFTAPMIETEYEAVSYVWGSDCRDQTIICNGRRVALTTNLFRALQRVRQPDATRSIWADLICINQEDLDEKGHQVAIMGKIYRHATRVLIYMGCDDMGHGLLVRSLLDTVCTAIDRLLEVISRDWNAFPYPSQEDPILNDRRWDSLRLLLGQVWFTRGWVVREAGFAQNGQVYWGDSDFSWFNLMRTCAWLYKRAANTLYSKSFDSCIPLAHVEVFEDRHPEYAKLFTTEMTWVNSSLLGYLSLTKQLKLKDPRDRIYAFLELVENEERPIHLRPNYKDNFLHVYWQFAAEYIRSTRYIGLLSNVEHNGQSLISGIPSWVPRWDLTITRTGYAFAPADSGYLPLTSNDGSLGEPKVTNDTILSSNGAIIDSVLYASDALDGQTTNADTISRIWRAIETTVVNRPYPTEHCLSVFLSILTAGTREGEVVEWLRSMASFYQMIYEWNNNPTDMQPPSYLAKPDTIDLFLNTVKGYTHNRKIILTARGYMGLAPAVTEKGDSCSLIFGCTTPSILRETSVKARYKYLGAAYIIGKEHWTTSDGRVVFSEILGSADSKDWLDWGVEEQEIRLC